MSLQEWSAITQILAAFFGIPSLIFLGVQVSLAAKAVRASSSQAHSATYHELLAGYPAIGSRASIWTSAYRMMLWF